MHLYRRQNYNPIGTGILAFIAGAAIWHMLGPKIKEKVAENKDFRKLRDEISEKISQISDLTREKYDEIVDQAVNNYSKIKDLSQNELKDLASDLKFHWYKIREAWKRD